jgi:hypothetical protein
VRAKAWRVKANYPTARAKFDQAMDGNNRQMKMTQCRGTADTMVNKMFVTTGDSDPADWWTTLDEFDQNWI